MIPVKVGCEDLEKMEVARVSVKFGNTVLTVLKL